VGGAQSLTSDKDGFWEFRLQQYPDQLKDDKRSATRSRQERRSLPSRERLPRPLERIARTNEKEADCVSRIDEGNGTGTLSAAECRQISPFAIGLAVRQAPWVTLMRGSTPRGFEDRVFHIRCRPPTSTPDQNGASGVR